MSIIADIGIVSTLGIIGYGIVVANQYRRYNQLRKRHMTNPMNND